MEQIIGFHFPGILLDLTRLKIISMVSLPLKAIGNREWFVNYPYDTLDIEMVS